MKAYWGLYPVLLLVIASGVHAALIYGNVYDLELNTVQAIVEVNSTPRQVMVSRNGTYQFSVHPGSYAITARLAKPNITVSERIEVRQEGNYVIDLIFFPDFSEDDELLNESLDVIEYEEPEYIPAWAYALLVLAVLASAAAILLKKRKKSVEEKKEGPEQKQVAKADLAEIMAFIKKEGGRTTQKDLRQAIPYSEAKISLMIAELEHQGKVKKIKKGRGNIIILP
ncbi:MAG: hypothetical protein QXM31_01835 [Candidatus Woesearchaeota archaeon]